MTGKITRIPANHCSSPLDDQRNQLIRQHRAEPRMAIDPAEHAPSSIFAAASQLCGATGQVGVRVRTTPIDCPACGSSLLARRGNAVTLHALPTGENEPEAPPPSDRGT
jgi:hypothetical protein